MKKFAYTLAHILAKNIVVKPNNSVQVNRQTGVVHATLCSQSIMTYIVKAGSQALFPQEKTYMSCKSDDTHENKSGFS